MATAKVKAYRAARQPAAARPLAELLPLDTPLSLMLDPGNTCNFRCVFCPTGDRALLARAGRPRGRMSQGLFRKLIDDLAGFPRPVGTLHLYKDGEPLINRDLAGMIAYARQSSRVERIETTTNGALLTPERSAELIEAGLDGIRISIYGVDDAGYRAATGTRTSFETIRAHVAALYARKLAVRPQMRVHCKLLDDGLTPAGREAFLEAFGPIADSVHIRPRMHWSSPGAPDAAPAVRAPAAMHEGERIACAEPFMKLAVNFNGEVSVCCADWAHDTIVGDARNAPLSAIWNGARLRAFRLTHLAGKRMAITACASCDYVRCLPAQADFDDRRDQLFAHYAGV